MNLIIPVQGAEGPAVGKIKEIHFKVQLLALLQSDNRVSVILTSHAGSVRRIHGNHGLRGAGWTAHSCLIQGSHTEDVGPPFHQTRHREAGVLHWDIIALSPVVCAYLASAKETETDINFKHKQQFCLIMV